MSTEVKPTNPKDIVGSTKLPMGLVPETAVAEMATAFLEGALKYGRFNWRVDGVRASVYYDAMKRHSAKWFNGEDCDATTRVKHLASVMACCAIIMDAEIAGKLTDDRPPSVDMTAFIDGMTEKVKHLQGLFRGHHPRQWTITDTQLTEGPSVANFVHANGRQALFGEHIGAGRCIVCGLSFGVRGGVSPDRGRVCAECRPGLELKMHSCSEGCPDIPRAAGETS